MHRNWLYITIGVLAIACLLLTGYIIGQKIGRGSHYSDRSMFFVVERVLAPLSESRRSEIKSAIAPNQKELRMALRSLNHTRKKINAHLNSNEFNREELTASLAKMRVQLNKVKELQDKSWIDLLDRLSAEERILVLQRLGKRWRDKNDEKDNSRVSS